MSYWLNDHQLFLYAKGIGSDDVHLWRCKKPVSSSSSSSSSSSLVMPMKSDDFDYVSNVKTHLELIDYDLFPWDETDYKRLVRYIFERRLLVNSQGFVIAELLHKVVDQQDENKIIDDANEEVPAIYIRSLDVLALKPYIPMLMERPIPLRTVQILEDVNGKAAVMEEDSKVTKLTARVDNLEGKVTKLTTDLATTTGNVADLQSKNKILEAENKTLEAENKILASNVKTLEGKVATLTADLEGKVATLTANLATALNTWRTLQGELNENPYYKEDWMNDLTNTEWVGFLKLTTYICDKITIIRQKGTFTTDENSTNVGASYWYTMKINDYGTEFKAITNIDLTNMYKARFSKKTWFCVEYRAKRYIYRPL